MTAKKKTKKTQTKRTTGHKMTPMKKTAKKKLAKKRGPLKKGSAKKKVARKIAAMKTKAVGQKTIGAKTVSAFRKRVREKKSDTLDTVAFPQEGPQTRSGRQSGDLQGLSSVEVADSESVDELLEEGNAFEADVVMGVEDAGDHDGREVHTHQVSEDDVPKNIGIKSRDSAAFSTRELPAHGDNPRRNRSPRTARRRAG